MSGASKEEKMDTSEAGTEKLMFKQTPSDVICVAYGSASFTAELTREADEFKWFLDDKHIGEDDTDCEISCDDHAYSLTINNLRILKGSQQPRTVRFEARNSTNRVTDTSSLTVRKVKVMMSGAPENVPDFEEVKKVMEIISKQNHIELVTVRGPADTSAANYVNKNLPQCDYMLSLKTKEYADENLSSKLAWDPKRNGKASLKLIPIYSRESDERDVTDPHGLFLRERNSPDIRECFHDELLRKLKDHKSLQVNETYPQGLVGRGLGLNYAALLTKALLGKAMDAQYKALLKKLNKKRKSENKRELKEVVQTFIVVSLDCSYKPKGKMSEYGDAFDPEQGRSHGLQLQFKDVHGADRRYFLDAYELKRDNEEYLVRVEFPNILTILDKMTLKKGTAVKADEAHYRKMNEQERNFHRRSFILETKLLLDMQHKDKYVMIETDTDLENDIIGALKEAPASISMKRNQVLVFGNTDNTTAQLQDFKNTLTERPDIELLDSEKFENSLMDAPGDKVNFYGATALFFATRGVLSDVQRRIADSFLGFQNKNGFKQVFAVLADDIEVDNHAYFDRTTSFQYHDKESAFHEDFMEDIVHICSVRIPLTYPLADVHHGLVWAFALNYLKLVMPGKVKNGSFDNGTKKMKPSVREYLKMAKRKYPNAIVYPKAIHITERRCRDTAGTTINMAIELQTDHMQLKCSESTIKEATKQAILKILRVHENRLQIDLDRVKEQDGNVRFKVSLGRSGQLVNYAQGLAKIADRFAAEIDTKGITLDIGETKHRDIKASVTVTEKPFAQFEGIEELDSHQFLTDGDMAGGIPKPITLGLYKVTYEGQDYIACFEFVRAILSIGEIMNNVMIPISPEKREEQFTQFNKLFQECATLDPDIRNTCELLAFDADAEDQYGTPLYRDQQNELKLNKVIAEFIKERTEAKPEYYSELERDFVPRSPTA